MRHQKGFGLMEALLASVISGLILLSFAKYQKNLAENKSRNNEASQLIGLVSQIKRYSETDIVNGKANPILKGNEKSIYKNRDLDWLKLDSCPGGQLPTNKKNTAENDFYVECNFRSEFTNVDYLGTSFTFENLTKSGDINRKVTKTSSYFGYVGKENERIADLASRVLNYDHERFPSSLKVNIVSLRRKGNKGEYIVDDKIKYSAFVGISGSRETFVKALSKGETLALEISMEYRKDQALKRDGSVSLTKDAKLCWDTSQGSATPCLNIKTLNKKTELNLTDFDYVTFKNGNGKNRTPMIGGYYTFSKFGKDEEIDAIDCPDKYETKFSAVISSFSSAGQNADFKDQSNKISNGTNKQTKEHALVSGISLDWIKRSDKWIVSSDIGIEDGVIKNNSSGSNNSLLHNPFSISFIGFQWCQEK